MKLFNKNQGFTLIEVLIGIVIAGIIIVVGVPSFKDMTETIRLKSAAEKYVSTIHLVHSESIRRQANLHISYQSGTNWCFGLDDTAACNCSTSNDCQVDSVEVVTDSSEFNNVTFTPSGFTSNDIEFEGVRGTTTDVGQVTFALNGKSIVVAVNFMGRVDVCSNNITGYQTC